MRALLFTVVSVLCVRAATVEVRNVGPAVAHAYIKGYTGSCKWNLYQGASVTGTPHPDVAGVVDTSRSDTIYDEFGTRIMRLGHDYGDNFLRVNTQYTLAVDAADTGCAGTAPVTFSTYFQPPTVVQRSFIPKWNASTYTKTAEPSYDWTNAGRRKLYVHRPKEFRLSSWIRRTLAPGITPTPTLMGLSDLREELAGPTWEMLRTAIVHTLLPFRTPLQS